MKKQVLLFVETSRGFGRGIIEGVSRYVLERDHWSIFFQDRGTLEKIPRWVRQWKGDGIIARTPNHTIDEGLREKGVPMVELLGNGTTLFPDVVCDNILIGKMAAEHFRERGFQHFAYFSPENWHWSAQRCDSYVEAVKSHGFSCSVFPHGKRKNADYASSIVTQTNRERLVDWLRGLPKPLALFVALDIQSLHVLDACKAAGMAVPEDIAILGVDNDWLLCRVGSPPLSSIDPNTWRIGYQAAALLDALMNGESLPTEPVLIPPAGVVTRGSTDIVAIEDSRMAQILNYIRENLSHPIPIDKLARNFGISRRTLERRFQNTLRRTAEEEIIRLRLERAKTLLRDTDLAIHEIGMMAGFSSPEYFTRLFHQKCGMTPKKYRLLNQTGRIH